ncbi:MAG: LPS assembly protein LptD [Nitrospirota bacterium]
MSSEKYSYKIIIFFILFFPLFSISYSLTSTYCFAEEQTIITSNFLEYEEETSTYIAKGNVKIQKADTVIESNEISYNEQTSEVVASGNVRYDDAEIAIKASRVELNLERETGRLYDAEVLYKKDNYHISGKEIEKRSGKYYFAPEATFTTCDAPVPAWCFRGKDIDVLVGERLKARDVSFLIKNIPVLYTPYVWAPIHTERETGFLMPGIGYSTSRGVHLNTPFFWAISENRDATITMDIYTEKGIGKGLEYRYIEPKNIRGNWWLYHIRDMELNKDFYELRALHEQRSTDGIGGFLNVDLINEKDFYREFSPYLEIRTSRFLESTGEMSFPFKYSRIYLLSQYWVDLAEEIRPAPQRLPEAGYILNPTKVGHFWFSTMAALSNFWRNEGVYGQRLDIYPRILHKLGNEIVVSQALGLRETAYSLHRNDGGDSSPHREAIEYNVIAKARLLKGYDSFTHVLEPCIGYTLITDSESLPFFDSTELFKKTSKIELSLINRFLDEGGEFVVLRASQGFDSYYGDRPFLPFKLEVGIKRPISLRLDASYDVHGGKVESINSDLRLKVSETTFLAGQRYNRQEDIILYKAGIELHPYKPWYMGGRLWYDAEEKVVRDITVNVKYMSQCWGVSMAFIKRPGDFTVAIVFELRGISRAFKI